MNQTVGQLLKTKEFPLSLYNANGKLTYYEDSNKYWIRYEYGPNGKLTYFENSIGTKHGTPRNQPICENKEVRLGNGLTCEIKDDKGRVIASGVLLRPGQHANGDFFTPDTKIGISSLSPPKTDCVGKDFGFGSSELKCTNPNCHEQGACGGSSKTEGDRAIEGLREEDHQRDWDNAYFALHSYIMEGGDPPETVHSTTAQYLQSIGFDYEGVEPPPSLAIKALEEVREDVLRDERMIMSRGGRAIVDGMLFSKKNILEIVDSKITQLQSESKAEGEGS